MNRKVVITYICPEIPDQICRDAANRLLEEFPITIKMLGSVEEIFPLLSDSNYNTDIISIDIEHLYKNSAANVYEIVNTLKTLLNCTVYRPARGKPMKRETKILTVVGDTTDLGLIREMNKLVDGFTLRLGGAFTYDDIRAEVQRIIDREFGMPRKLAEMIKRRNSRTRNTAGEIVLTPRQRQIYTLIIEKGASNKAIGRLLSISESTVKLHMTAILKKYGVRNRTQLAVFAKKPAVNTVSTSQDNK